MWRAIQAKLYFNLENNFLNQILMQQDHIIVLSICNDIVEATIVQEKLKANGIDSFLENENVMGLDPLGGIH